MSEAYVSEQSCNRTHNAIQLQLERDEKQLNSQSDEIHTVNEAVIKITMLLEGHEKRIESLESSKHKPPPTSPFWGTSAGQWGIKAGIILVFIVVLAAIGQTIDVDVVKGLLGK